MPKKILVAVAWPYVNGEPHLGHIAGMNVPADIFARYHRLRGNQVAMVSGSDMHGTPTALKALDEGVEPIEIAMKYHEIWKESLKKMPRLNPMSIKIILSLFINFSENFCMIIWTWDKIKTSRGIYCSRSVDFRGLSSRRSRRD